MKTSLPRRRPPKVDTERADAIRSCGRHLQDLRRAHKNPPANVLVNQRGIPKFVPAIIEQSFCTSPAALCVELGETLDDAALGEELASQVEAEPFGADQVEEIL